MGCFGNLIVTCHPVSTFTTQYIDYRLNTLSELFHYTIYPTRLIYSIISNYMFVQTHYLQFEDDYKLWGMLFGIIKLSVLDR